MSFDVLALPRPWRCHSCFLPPWFRSQFSVTRAVPADTLNKLPLKKLQQRGLKIPITDIYNPNGPSIKDAS